jgi:soluble lytic murein transglycosylase-like protein
VRILFRVTLFAALACAPAWCEDMRTRALICADFYAERYGVARELVHAIIEVESAWRPYAISSKGAAGLMQLMPATAATFGVRNRFHIEENIQGGVAYLSWLQQRFHGDLRLVAAAYFAGENRIAARGLRYSSPEVYRYVSRAAEICRREGMEALPVRR